MRKRGVFLSVLLSLCVLGPAATFAGRPLVTEDARTVEIGFCELELALDYSRDHNLDQNYIPSAQLAYGVTDRAEVGVASGYIIKDIHEGGREDSLGDVTAYLKYRIWGEEKDFPAFTLKPQLKIPTASEKKGLGSGEVDFGLTAIFSKSLAALNLHFDVGYTLIGKKEATDELSLGLAAEYGIRKWLVAVSEIRHSQNFNSHSQDDPASFLLGLQIVAGKAQWDAALRLGLNNAAPDYAFTFGVTLKF